MKNVVRRCAALIAVLAAIVILAFAALRLAAPLLIEQREIIEELVSASIGRSVSIGAIEAEWRGLDPRVRLQDVQVLDAGGEAALSFDRASITLDWWGTLLSGDFKFAGLHVRGAQIHVVRETDGTIVLRGLGASPRAQIGTSHDMALTLHSSQVRWEDRVLDVDYQFGGIDIALDTRSDKLRLAADLAPPSQLGARLELAADLQGTPAEPAGWEGKVYIRAEDVQAEHLPKPLRAGLTRGGLSLEAWSVWRGGEPVSVSGSLEVDDATVAGAPATGRPSIRKLQAQFCWRRQGPDWTLQVADLALSRAGRSWKSDTVTIAYREERHEYATLSGAFDYARIEDVQALLPRKQGITDGPIARLLARLPRGELADVRFEAGIQKGTIERYAASGRFGDFRIDATDDFPGIAGADGRFNFTQGGGDVDFDTRKLEIDHTRLFANILKVDYLQGRVQWRREHGRLTIESSALAAGNADAKVRGRVFFRLAGDSPHLDAQFSLRDGNVARAVHYLPVKVIKPKVYEWLERALVAGQLTAGEVMIKGNPRDFPFQGTKGVFEARLNFENGVLDYRPGWPHAEEMAAELVFLNRSIVATSLHAHVLGTTVESASIRIPDLREGQLRLEAKARGPVEDLVTYLHAANLVGSKAFKDVAIDGNSRLNLDIALPLSEQHPGERRVSGIVKLADAELDLVPWDIALKSINGDLTFGPEGFNAQDIAAQLRGHEVTIDVARGADKRSDISIRGRLPAAALLARFRHPLLNQVQGEAHWHAQVSLPAFKAPSETAEPAPIGLRIASELEGVAIRLPQPLVKRPSERRPFSLVTALRAGRQYPIRAQYGDDISAVFALSKDSGGLRLARGELRIGRGEAVLPEEGIIVKADLAELSVSAWQALIAAHGRGLLTGDGAERTIPLAELDIAVDRLHWSDQTFDDVRLKARRYAQRWLAKVDSRQVQGRILVPQDFRPGLELVADLERLEWTTGEGQKRTAIDPRRLPPLLIRIKNLRIDALEFNSLHAKTLPLEDGMRVQILSLSARDFEGHAQGNWRVSGEGRQRSSFRLVLKSEDLGALLRQWDLLHSVRDGVARVEAYLSWPGAPWRFNLEGLKGDAQMRVEDGRLREVDPGAGRLLGLLNLDAISRRLALDFRDLFRTGFSFDMIESKLRFANANLYTDDLVMQGPPAKIEITGRAGLVARDLDLRMIVTPQIISGLPLAGALLGGPAIGAAIFVAQQVLNELEPEMDKGAGIPYTVSGSWGDPSVELAEAPVGAQTRKKFPYNIR